MRSRGRPLKLTQELVDKVSEFSRIAMTWDDLAAFLGVRVSTLRYWRRYGERENERRLAGKEPNEKYDVYVNLLAVTKEARLKSKYKCLMKIHEIGFGGQPKPEDKTYGNWQALAWLLERQYPDEFALASRTKLAELAEQIKSIQKGD